MPSRLCGYFIPIVMLLVIIYELASIATIPPNQNKNRTVKSKTFVHKCTNSCLRCIKAIHSWKSRTVEDGKIVKFIRGYYSHELKSVKHRLKPIHHFHNAYEKFISTKGTSTISSQDIIPLLSAESESFWAKNFHAKFVCIFSEYSQLQAKTP